MKPRNLTVLALALTALSTPAAAQRIGVKAGASFNRDSLDLRLPVLSGPSDETTFVGGVAVDAEMVDRLRLQMEVLYQRRSTTVTFADPTGQPPIRVEYDLDYIVVPLLARYDFTPGPLVPYAVLGTQLGFRIDASSRNTSDGAVLEENIGEQFKRVDVGIVVGGGVGYRLSGSTWLTGDLRYVHGLINIAENPLPDDEWRTRSVQLMVGVAFRM